MSYLRDRVSPPSMRPGRPSMTPLGELAKKLEGMKSCAALWWEASPPRCTQKYPVSRRRIAWSENDLRGGLHFGDLDAVTKSLQTLDMVALELLLAPAVVVVLAKVIVGNAVLDNEVDDGQYLVTDGHD